MNKIDGSYRLLFSFKNHICSKPIGFCDADCVTQ